MDNELSIHLGEDQTKYLLFASKRKINRVLKLIMKCKNMQLKQHSRVTYVGCILDETMSGESVTLKMIH